MRKLRYRHFFSGICLLLLLVPLSVSQNRVRRVDQNKNNYPNYPIEVVGCDLGDGLVSRCSDIVAGPDWWKNLTLSLKNVSSKTISEFNFELSVEKQGQMSLPMPVVLVPQPPFEQVNDVQGNRTFNYRRKVLPGDIFRMTVVGSEFEQKTRFLRSLAASEIDTLSFSIQFIFFDDGTRWDFGQYSQIRSGQSLDITQKRINRLTSGDGSEPLQIVSVQANGKTVSVNEVFTGDGEWLKDLTIIFKNISGRKIRTITFYMSVLESKPTGPPPGMPIIYGTPRTFKPDSEKVTSLATGETASVKIDSVLYENLKKSLAIREDLSKRTTAELRIMDIWFIDDTSWSWGKFYKLNQTGGLVLDGDGSGKKPHEK